MDIKDRYLLVLVRGVTDRQSESSIVRGTGSYSDRRYSDKSYSDSSYSDRRYSDKRYVMPTTAGVL